MSEANHPPGLWPVPGDGVLARHGHLILLSSLESGQFVDVMLDLLEQAAAMGGDGRQFTDQIAGVLDSDEATEMVADDDAESGPSVLAFGTTDMGMSVVVSGNAWVDITTTHGTQRVKGRPARHAAALHTAGAGIGGQGECRHGRQRRGERRPVLPARCRDGAGQRAELLLRRRERGRSAECTRAVDGSDADGSAGARAGAARPRARAAAGGGRHAAASAAPASAT